MNGTLEGKVALVTGGSSGIGRDSSLTFAREGAQVIVSDVSVEGGEETVSLIKEAGGVAIFIKADVSKSTDVDALITKGIETYGRLDVAFNNAGIEGVRVPMA
ncbi:MAG: SDR family NAD(P)-dependent oxidoreductase, partial [Chloroflexi bacterium]|nr:SDR family NAD(P)-dependent oxidoreductase [Chloroflexota bacterium]